MNGIGWTCNIPELRKPAMEMSLWSNIKQWPFPPLFDKKQGFLKNEILRVANKVSFSITKEFSSTYALEMILEIGDLDPGRSLSVSISVALGHSASSHF